MERPPFRVKAIYDYTSRHDDDLSFSKGQIIKVSEEEDAEWYYGEYEDTLGNKRKGLFPKNFVTVYEPELPQRPTRSSRSKKESMVSALPADKHENSPAVQPGLDEPETDVITPSGERVTNINEPSAEISHDTTSAVQTSQGSPSVPLVNAANKPTHSNAAKPTSSLVAEKPMIGSFRDRINAFNKPAVGPVAPPKPGGLGSPGGAGFIKKPFVAPPPSKNAYVPSSREPPPQRLYRREEDPEIIPQPLNNAENNEGAALPLTGSSVGDEDAQPKPTSLKDRIALLQKQQLEQAARHADAGQRKEKPKRPPKKRMASQERALGQENQAESEAVERIFSSDSIRKRSTDLSRDDQSGSRSIASSHKSRDTTPLASPTTAPSREFLSDANDADQSGAGDTEDGEEMLTGQADSDEKRHGKTSMASRRLQLPMREANVEREVTNEDQAQEEIEGEEENVDQKEEAEEEVVEEEEEEEEVDSEVKRRIKIRERMAKMSGGMGMPGMFGPAGGMPSIASRKQGSASSERKPSAISASAITEPSASQAPPIPLTTMLGIPRVSTPEQELKSMETGEATTDEPRTSSVGQTPNETPDDEGRNTQSAISARTSTDSTVTAPIPQGMLSCFKYP